MKTRGGIQRAGVPRSSTDAPIGTGLKDSPSSELPEVKRESDRVRAPHAEAVRDRVLKGTGLYNFLVGTPSMPGAFSPALREEERAHHSYVEQRDVGRNTPGGTTSKQLSKPIPD